MKVLVLGGAGYIGQVVVQRLVDAGHTVKVADIFKFSLPGHLPRGVGWVVCDTRALLARDLRGIDAILDLAAISNDPSGSLDPELTRAINVEARSRIARLAKSVGVGRYLLFSSCSVYGINDDLVDEYAPLRPLTEYALSNVRAEERILSLADAGFCATAFRLATVFGPSPAMRFDLVVNTMARSAFECGKVVVTGGGNQFRPLIHVADVAEAATRVLALPSATVSGEVFNLVHRNARMHELALAVVAGIGRPIPIDVDSSSLDLRNYRVDGGKAERVLGFRAARTVEAAAHTIFHGLAAGRVTPRPLTIRLNGYRQMLVPAIAS
jgi:nucleoside-diphosphate-sugar epimerase